MRLAIQSYKNVIHAPEQGQECVVTAPGMQNEDRADTRLEIELVDRVLHFRTQSFQLVDDFGRLFAADGQRIELLVHLQ
eukprot:2399102-Pleurochrysis_carterae.AAC.1